MSQYTVKLYNKNKLIRTKIYDEKSLFRHIFWYRMRRRCWFAFKCVVAMSLLTGVSLAVWFMVIKNFHVL